MKNGLLFVLLMAALVAMAMPAGAVAPTINQLPAVVISDKEDIDVATNAVLLRYVNVANLNDITNEPNSGDSSKLKFWYETTGAKLKVGNPTIKTALTAAEVTALKAATPTMPPTAKEITGGTAFWMSLIQDSPGAGKVSATSVATATAAANGAQVSELTAAGATGKQSMTLYAIDDVLTSKSWGSMTFDVYSLTGSSLNDSYSPPVTNVYAAPFTGGTDGWTFIPGSATGFVAGTQASSSTGLGVTGATFTASASTIGRLASWASPLQVVAPASGMVGYYYLGTFQFSGNAASASAAPGFRLLYLSTAYVHLGGIQVLSPASGISTAFEVAYTGNNRTINLAWAVPTDLVEYGDTGILNKSVQPANDLRTYALQFDLMQTDATDAGALFLEDVLVQKAPRPANVTPGKAWGGTDTAFNAPTGWVVSAAAPTGFSVGSGTITGVNTMTLALSGTNTDGFKSLVPATAAGLPSWTAGKLLRTSYTVASSNAAQTPAVRFLTLGTRTADLAPVFWGDELDYSIMRGTVTPAQSAAGLPGSYKTAGSTVEFYAPSQYVGTGAEAAFLTPQVDLIQTAATYPLNGWARPAATVTISAAKMELVNP